MTPEEFQRQLSDIKKNLTRFIQKGAPMIAAAKSASMFRENFQREHFFGERWKEVQRRMSSVKRGKKTVKNNAKGTDRSRKILTGKTGNLGRSIQVRIKTSEAEVFSDAPYASVHNEGLTAGRGRGKFRMPRRRFIGPHPKVDRAVLDTLQTELNKVLNNYK
jgi:phage gpG-like protein